MILTFGIVAIVSIVFNLYLFRYLELNALSDMEAMLFLAVPIPILGTIVLLFRLASHISHEMKPETIAWRVENKIFWENVEKQRKVKEEKAARIARGEFTPAERRKMAEEARIEKRWVKAQASAMQKPRRSRV